MRAENDRNGVVATAKAVFEQHDKDGNGTLSIDEVRRCTRARRHARARTAARRLRRRAARAAAARRGPRPARLSRAARPRPAARPRAQVRKMVLDTNPEITDLELRVFFINLDVNRDNVISEDEFMVWYESSGFSANDLA